MLCQKPTKIITVTMPNGSKFSYGHDTNTDEITSITQSTEEGEPNTINRIYTAGYLTELNASRNNIRFQYDELGRKSKVFINDTKPYVQFEHIERKDAYSLDTQIKKLSLQTINLNML